jgi:hypothetical protein
MMTVLTDIDCVGMVRIGLPSFRDGSPTVETKALAELFEQIWDYEDLKRQSINFFGDGMYDHIPFKIGTELPLPTLLTLFGHVKSARKHSR